MIESPFLVSMFKARGMPLPAHLEEDTAKEIEAWVGEHMPLPDVPSYHPSEYGDWRLSQQEIALPIRGWFSGLAPRRFTNYVLTHIPTNRIWMSLSPLELESHAFHVAAAHGKVLVAGLGMGMYLFNILRKPEVTEVHVLEQSEEVVAAFRAFAKPEEWEGWEKVTIHLCDALEPSPELVEQVYRPDYLYADIWPSIADHNAREQMSEMCASYNPKEAGYWCVEADLFYDMPRREQEVENLEEAVQSLYSSYDIPLPICRVIPDEHIRLLLVQAVGYNLMMM